MNRPSSSQLVTGFGILSLLMGLGLSIHTIRAQAEWQQRLTTKRELIVRLTALGQEWQRAQSIKTSYEALSPGAMLPVQDIFTKCFTNRVIAPAPMTSSSPLPGWTEWKTSANIDGIAVSDLSPLMTKLAAQEPPWTVTRCDLSATGQSNGLIRVSLGLASLRRDAWPSPGEHQPATGTP